MERTRETLHVALRVLTAITDRRYPELTFPLCEGLQDPLDRCRSTSWLVSLSRTPCAVTQRPGLPAPQVDANRRGPFMPIKRTDGSRDPLTKGRSPTIARSSVHERHHEDLKGKFQHAS